MVAPNIADEPRLLTLDELMSHENKRLEILDGEILEMSTAGVSHHIFVSNIHNALYEYQKLHPDLGLLMPDGVTFLMFSDKKRLRDSFVPDVSFVLAENFIPMDDLTKPYPGVPDLAVEVVSPDDKPDEIARKIRTYLDKGTAQVWVIYQQAREVYQYRASEPDNARLYSGSQIINAEPLLPGFTIALDDVFKIPHWLAVQRNTPADE